MTPAYNLIPFSDALRNARTYGYYVREQVEAHGPYLPEWHLEAMVNMASDQADECIDFLNEVVGLEGMIPEDHLGIALEAITVRDMPLETFSELIEEIVNERLDSPEETGL
jgi:hypothetical protein